MEEEISLVELFQMLKKHIGLIIGTTLAGFAILAIYTLFIATPTYESSSQLLVSRPTEENTIQQSQINANIQLINTYEDIITNPVILDPVIEELGLDTTVDQLRERISVSTAEESQVFSVDVTGEDPYLASEIANTTASVFQNNLDSIMNVDNVTVISQAVPDTDAVSPNTVLNLVIGILLGGMIGIGAAFLIEFLDTTVKDESFIEQELGWTSLGRVSEMSIEEALPQESVESEDESTSRSNRRRV